MDKHEKLKQRVIKQGQNDPENKRDFLEFTNEFNKLLVVPLEGENGFQVFLNGEYIFDIYLSTIAKTQTNNIQMFASHLERQRDRAYPPVKGYYLIYQGDASRKELQKPYNPLGLLEPNLDVFIKMLTFGFPVLKEKFSGSEKMVERAKNLLEWLGIDIPE